MARNWLTLMPWAVAVALAACGGGGGGGVGETPGPAPAATMSLFAGSLKRPGSEDGTGEAAGFYVPEGVALDAAGNIYVADTGNHTVRRIAPGGIVTTIAGAAGLPGRSDGPPATARLKTPTDIAIGPGGVLYVAGDSAVRRVAPDRTVSTFAGVAGEAKVVAGDGAQARFTAITGVAVDTTGNVHVSEMTVTGGRLRRFDALAKSLPLGTQTTGFLTIPFPSGIAVDAAGHVYIASGGPLHPDLPHLDPPPAYPVAAIYRVASDGDIALIAGSVTWMAGEEGKSRPMGVAADAAGRVVFSDAGRHSVRRVEAQGRMGTLAGGDGIGRADGAGGGARFSSPSDLAAAADAGLYLVDVGNASLRRISPAGVVSTVPLQGDGGQALQPRRVAANPQGGFYVMTGGAKPFGWSCTAAGQCRALDLGNALSSSRMAAVNGNLYLTEGSQASVIGSNGVRRVLANDFGFAGAIVASPGGKVYVADSDRMQVRVFDADGRAVQTVGTGVSGYRDGAAAQAQFASPVHLALDAAGNLYINDILNNTVRKLSADGSTVSTVAGVRDNPGPPQMGPATSALGRANGMAWQNGALYVTVDQAVVKISPVN